MAFDSSGSEPESVLYQKMAEIREAVVHALDAMHPTLQMHPTMVAKETAEIADELTALENASRGSTT